MFSSPEFLSRQGQEIINFYRNRCVDPTGGYFQNFHDDGSRFAPARKHLVSSTRMMFNFYRAHAVYGEAWMREHAAHGFRYLRDIHWVEPENLLVWALDESPAGGQQIRDLTQHCYGFAFTALALAAAVQAREPEAEVLLRQVMHAWQSGFWIAEQGLYADELARDGKPTDYRGQNANMHACEALIQVYQATGDETALNRAAEIAETITGKLTSATDGLVWEHYSSRLEIDWDYNRDDPKNLYKPWGFQPGHQTEWSKLLLTLYRLRPDSKWLGRAEHLFRRSVEVAWDTKYDGLCYGFSPDGSICDHDKYFWVQAETIVASAMLFKATGDRYYSQWYERLWHYCWEVFVDHRHGAWYRIRHRDNSAMTDRKSEAGSKCDYHNLNAVIDLMDILKNPD